MNDNSLRVLAYLVQSHTPWINENKDTELHVCIANYAIIKMIYG